MQLITPKTDNNRNPQARGRWGAATVELAVCLPMMMTIVLGSIEATNAVFLRQALAQAAYEGARAASTSGVDDATARARCQAVLTARNIHGATITITPTIVTNTARGTDVTVQVAAPVTANSVAPQWYYESQSVSAQLTMVRL